MTTTFDRDAAKKLEVNISLSLHEAVGLLRLAKVAEYLTEQGSEANQDLQSTIDTLQYQIVDNAPSIPVGVLEGVSDRGGRVYTAASLWFSCFDCSAEMLTGLGSAFLGAVASERLQGLYVAFRGLSYADACVHGINDPLGDEYIYPDNVTILAIPYFTDLHKPIIDGHLSLAWESIMNYYRDMGGIADA